MIASQHANARTAAATDWSAIATAYARLVALTRSPVARLNHAVAVGMAEGPHAGLVLLEELDELDDFHLLRACRGSLRVRVGGAGWRRSGDYSTTTSTRWNSLTSV